MSFSSTQKVKLVQSSQPPQSDTKKNKRKEDELKSVFNTFDKNKDGYITRNELKQAMNGAGMIMNENQIDEMLENMDVNRDGFIDLREFCASFVHNDDDDDDEDGDLREAFEVFDVNKDGVISVKELEMVLVSLGLKQGGMKLHDFEDMIRKVDVDGDGMIDFNEFKKMMKSGVTLFTSSSLE